MAPVIAVDGDAVQEQRDRSLSLLDIGDASGFDLGEAAPGVKPAMSITLIAKMSPLLRRPFRPDQLAALS